jgi:hypothetical protein
MALWIAVYAGASAKRTVTTLPEFLASQIGQFEGRIEPAHSALMPATLIMWLLIGPRFMLLMLK